MSNIRKFINDLDKSIRDNFPNTQSYIIYNGDSIKDLIIELRENDKRLRYSPYKLYDKSDNYKYTIDKLLKQWRDKLEE